MSCKIFSVKAVKSGKIIELYEYERVQVVYEGDSCVKRTEKALNPDQGVHDGLRRSDNLGRSKRRIRRLINSNVDMFGFRSVFLTLTFKDDIEDLTVANCEFEKFVKRMNRRYSLKLKYIAVPEIQRERLNKYGSAVWHYHVVIFNLPFVSVNEIRRSVWKQGFIKLNCLDDVNNVGSYVTKYVTENGDVSPLKGRRSFLASQGLFEPEEITDFSVIGDLLEDTERCKRVWNHSYKNEWEGEVQYSVYRLDSEDLEYSPLVREALKIFGGQIVAI